MSEATEAVDTPAPSGDPVRRWTYIVIAVLLVLVGFSIAIDRLAPITYQTTAETLVVPVAPQVSGEILSVPIADNSRVNKGQLLALIDPTNYRIALESAQADYVAAVQSVASDRAAVQSARAVLTAQQAILVQADQDNTRTGKLVDVGYATRAKLEVTMSTLATAQANVAQAQAELTRAIEQLGPPGAGNPQLRSAAAALEAAQQNLAWTRLTAPVGGYIANLVIGKGSFAKAGTPVISLIDTDNAGLIGYFRENQLGNIVLGAPALIALDVFPGQIFKGKVIGLGGGISTLNQSASPGSLVEAPNSNWLESGQRLPIRIGFDKGELPRGVRQGSQASVMIDNGMSPPISWLSRMLLKLRSYLSYIS